MILVQLALRWWRHGFAAPPPRDDVVEVTRGYVRVRVEGRTATVDGDFVVGGRREPNFEVYGHVVWDDGAPVTPQDRMAILSVLRERAPGRGLRLEWTA